MQIPQIITNWIGSNYEVDNTYQGYVTLNLHSWKGRVVSLIDIPSQIVHGAGVSLSCMIRGALKVAQSALHLTKGFILFLPVAFITPFINLHSRNLWQNYMCNAFINSKEALSDGLFLLTFETIAQLFFSAVKIQADIAGVILPEVGRQGRLWGKERTETPTPSSPAPPFSTLA